MPLRTCSVTFTDARGIRHTVDVTAESLFETAVLGLQVLRQERWIEEAFGAGARIEVQVREPVTTHVVTLQQIERWLSGATIIPNERVKKDRLRTMLRSAHGAKPPL